MPLGKAVLFPSMVVEGCLVKRQSSNGKYWVLGSWNYHRELQLCSNGHPASTDTYLGREGLNPMAELFRKTDLPGHNRIMNQHAQSALDGVPHTPPHGLFVLTTTGSVRLYRLMRKGGWSLGWALWVGPDYCPKAGNSDQRLRSLILHTSIQSLELVWGHRFGHQRLFIHSTKMAGHMLC